MKKSPSINEVPEKAAVEIRKSTGGLAMNDTHFEDHVLFTYRGRKYYFVQDFDFGEGFRKRVYLLDDEEWEKTYEDLKALEWNYAQREWVRDGENPYGYTGAKFWYEYEKLK